MAARIERVTGIPGRKVFDHKAFTLINIGTSKQGDKDVKRLRARGFITRVVVWEDSAGKDKFVVYAREATRRPAAGRK